jgi:hypothetical protein
MPTNIGCKLEQQRQQAYAQWRQLHALEGIESAIRGNNHHYDDLDNRYQQIPYLERAMTGMR